MVMYKLVITGDRREDVDFEELKEYYLEEHAPLVKEMPHVQKFTVSFPIDDEDAEYDYIAALYYEEPEHIGASLESEAGQEAVEDVANFGDTDTGFNQTTEEHPVFDRT